MQQHKLKAWRILTKKEQAILRLFYVEGKTPNETSVIVNLRKYKLDEFATRAKKFFLIFSEYFEYNEDLFSPEMPISHPVKEYFKLVIYDRVRPKAASKKLGYPEIVYPSTRYTTLNAALADLNRAGFMDTVELIRTFDAWNNFRVIPKEFSKPSPFSRRQQRAYAHIIRAVSELTPLGYRTIKELNKVNPEPHLFIPIVADFIDMGLEILEVTDNTNNITYYSRNHIPLFKDCKDAQYLGELIFDWTKLQNKMGKPSISFWANIKKVIKKANNVEGLIGSEDFELSTQQLLAIRDLGSFNQ